MSKKQYYIRTELFPKDSEILGYRREHGVICQSKDHIETWFNYNRFEVGILFAKAILEVRVKKE